MKIDEGKILLLLSGILSGIVITSFLINTSISRTAILSYSDYRQKKAEQDKLKYEISNLEKNLDELNKKLLDYQINSSKDKDIYDTLKKEFSELKAKYGLTEANGPGIVIYMNDRTYYFNDFDRQLADNLVHNTDIMYVVQDLINAGAEAISINGIRYVSGMAITCSGPIISLEYGDHEEVITPEFKIEAIGNPETLYNGMNSPESHYQILKDRELPVRIEKKDNIKLKAANIDTESKILEKIKSGE
ncbi:DUF881 domain-containing protein [Fonticella tunisiensis]|uniref:Uncharacterized protein YlxW (UPF0749 family) n=1 Tax=Fonticella tunisiensis TaxID=1096341 RepID=A0A4R7KU81_9CLOT|nr:DUF881 domain-containing protein [Fonticella tunisiensis]TDT61854.1 uncharacterized protein YlxW (UPF0749 family) [Fonticella tunisiensis]